MRTLPAITLSNVRDVYAGAEGRLWELLMGEQIHIGGLNSSFDLARRAGIPPNSRGVDLCCASGAGMRFLVRFIGVAHMTGVDATPAMLALAARRAEEEGFAGKLAFVEADVCSAGLPSGQLDFAWGEDAWCYVKDKAKLISEAARVVRPGGIIAFTDWMHTDESMSDDEARRYMSFMKFPSILSLGDYQTLVEQNGCSLKVSMDTGRFARQMPLYLSMIEQQLTYDALKLIGFDTRLAESLIREMKFVEELARTGKIIQGLIVAEKSS